jgi:mannosyl-3-phosphoglycerate phosphatase
MKRPDIMPVAPDPKEVPAPFHVIFTDLDGSLLDHDTYSWAEASEALSLCRRKGVPVVMVSSKTGAEMAVLAKDIALSAPFVCENGGGIFIPEDAFDRPPDGAVYEGGFLKYALGTPYAELVSALRHIREELGWNIRGFSDMDAGEISRLTGLGQREARLAAQRDFDEPFVVLGQARPDIEPLIRASREKGLRVTAGGRFFHLHGASDKGLAMEKIMEWYRAAGRDVTAVALGDSPNDFPMLEKAVYPVLIRSRRAFPDLLKKIPRLIVTDQVGPKGWNQAVLDILS